jgi:SAM-dependent methyltransferase
VIAVETCPVCGSYGQERVYSVKNWLNEKSPAEAFGVMRCTACGMRFLSPRPEGKELERYYPQEYFGRPNRLSCIVKRHLLKRQIRVLKKRNVCGKVLEIGCGTGEFLNMLKDSGVSVVAGIEPDPYACDRARSRGLGDIQNTTIEQARLPEGNFDLVIMRHVLEHVADPRLVIEKVRGALKPGGIFIVWLPFAGTAEQRIFGRYWAGFDAPRHFVHFSVPHLRNVLETGGFEVDGVRHEAIPNFWIIGIRNFLREHDMHRLAGFFNDKSNVPLLMAFGLAALPIALCGGSGQGKITAIKRA